MPRVLNLETGVEHEVPEGHWSLEDAVYRVLPTTPEPTPEPEPEPAPAAKPKPKKGK